MGSRMKKSIAQQLNTADIRVSNSLTNDDIKTEVAKKGYTEAKLLEGQALHTTAKDAVNKAVARDGDAKKATDYEINCKAEAHKAYQDLAQIARAKYTPKSPELATLGLNGREPIGTAAFIKAGYVLFDNAASDSKIGADLLVNGYTPEFITSERAKIETYENANKAQVTAIGNALKATEEQRAALKAMNAWVSEYTKIAKVALRSDKKLLEKIGIFTGKRYNPKKDAGTESAVVPQS